MPWPVVLVPRPLGVGRAASQLDPQASWTLEPEETSDQIITKTKQKITWVGQKVHLGVSASCLANQIPMTHSLKTEDEMPTEGPMGATQELP